MSSRNIILVCLIGVVVFAGYQRNTAIAEPQEANSGIKIGIVSVKKIFENCKQNEKYRNEAIEERKKLEAELKKLDAEIEAAKAGLKTLKNDSPEYMEQALEVLTKQGNLQTQQEFYKRKLELKDQRWTEQLYEDILKYTKQVAEEYGLGLVLETDEPEIPSGSAQDLMLTIRTHKLLYSEGCVDITDKVMALVDGAD